MPPQFMKTREGKPFSLGQDRPAFLSGARMTPVNQVSEAEFRSLNKRHGTGDYEIVRPSFKRSEILPRQISDFDRLQALDIEKFGAKVQLSEGIKRIYDVEMPDPLDVKWLAEKARLTALYQARGMSDIEIEREHRVNAPLGRQQRTVTVKRNITTGDLTSSSKLQEILEEVRNGNAASMDQKAELLAAIANTLNSIATLSADQTAAVKESLEKINVPTSKEELGIRGRFVDGDEYKENRGLINLYLLNKARLDGRDLNAPVRNLDKDGSAGSDFVSLNTVQRDLTAGVDRVKFLDLDSGGVVNLRNLRLFLLSNPVPMQEFVGMSENNLRLLGKDKN